MGAGPGARGRGLGAEAQRLCASVQAEMERALLQGERQAELEQAESETDAIAQLQRTLEQLEGNIQRDKEQVGGASCTHARSHAHTRTHTLHRPSLLHRGSFCSFTKTALCWFLEVT